MTAYKTSRAAVSQLKTAVMDEIRQNHRPLSLRNVDNCQFSGLYAIWYKHRCLYVGQSERQTVYTRLYAHLSDCHNERLKLWIQVKRGVLRFTSSQVDDDESGTIRKLESYLICKLAPETNKQRPCGGSNNA